MFNVRKSIKRDDEMHGDENKSFAEEASKGRTNLLREYWDFIREERKWWIVPVLFVLLLMGVFVVLGGTSLAPFIYTLF
jgi:hypothetical protein